MNSTSQSKRLGSPIENLGKHLSSLSHAEKASFANGCLTSVGYLVQVSCGFRKASAELAIRIAKQSEYKITPHQIRPDIYPNPNDAMPTTVEAQLDADNVQVGAA